jgi:hypothetical protein
VTTKPEILAAIVVDWQKINTTAALHIETNYEGDAKYIAGRNAKIEADVASRKGGATAGCGPFWRAHELDLSGDGS